MLLFTKGTPAEVNDGSFEVSARYALLTYGRHGFPVLIVSHTHWLKARGAKRTCTRVPSPGYTSSYLHIHENSFYMIWIYEPITNWITTCVFIY